MGCEVSGPFCNVVLDIRITGNELKSCKYTNSSNGESTRTSSPAMKGSKGGKTKTNQGNKEYTPNNWNKL